jgi:tetratricopeptide (TPR) repeat protein
MQTRPQTFRVSSHPRDAEAFASARRHTRPRIPSTSGYMVAATATAGALFFVLWWMLQNEENPWAPAGLAASVVLLVAIAAREAVIRRAWSRYLVEHDSRYWRGTKRSTRASSGARSGRLDAASWRALQKHAAAVDSTQTLPEAHWEIYQLCTEYLANAEDTLHSADLSTENRLALRATQERARALQKQHLLAWARDSARSFTREAQQRVRLHEKIETANRALECIDSALEIYPNEDELNESALAVREFITSSRVAHWVELAERAAFKGHHRRAIDCYRDALFYLERDGTDNLHKATGERILREIELSKAQLATKVVNNLTDRESSEI